MKNLRCGASSLVVALVGTFALAGVGSGCSKLGGGSVTPQTDEEKTLYAYGFMLGRNAGALGVSPRELEVIKGGLTDSVLKKKPALDVEKFGPQMDTLARKRMN